MSYTYHLYTNMIVVNCSNAPVQTTLDVIGGKWKPLILWLLSENTMRFSELKKSIPGITQKMLTQQLRYMERDGLISRTIYPEIPPRVEYAVTDHGKTLGPVLEAMRKWGEKHQARSR